MKVFILMLLMHILDDFVLQPICLSKLKQKDWWIRQCQENNLDFDKYKTDYITALVMHSLSWSIMIHLPIMFIYCIENSVLLLSIFINMLIHLIVDNYKANLKKINLDTDQTIHLFQIIITFSFFTIYG